MTGKTIGKYRIISKLGRGGMGTVYKAVDETLEREVAVKVLNPELTEGDVMKRFLAEATILAKLNHPEIATIHEVHRADSEVLMVMELVRGETLDQLLQRVGPLPPERAAYLVAQVLNALEHAHRAGIIHRDLKPANVMVTEHGGIKIMDFGIARVVGAQHMTADGLMVGTPAYMAPERIVEKDVDARSDLYSAGVLFYRLLTAKLPFQADTAVGMVQKLLSETPTPARVHRADIPPWCETILDRALAKSPADRFQTAESFRAALMAAIAGATEQTGVHPLPQMAITPPPRPTPQPFDMGETVPTPRAMPVPTADSSASAASLPRSGPTPSREATVTLKKKQVVAAGATIAALAVAGVVVAVLMLRRPANEAESVTPAASPAEALTSTTTAPPTDIALPVTETSSPPEPFPSAGAAPPSTPARSDGTTAASARPPTPAPAVAKETAPVEPVRVVPTDLAPFRFEGKAVVPDGDKHRERDAAILVADGAVRVTERGARLLYQVPIADIVSVTYSNSRQPMWNSPDGPVEAMRVEGGAFGFMRGGGRNWFGLRTKDSLLMLRVDDDAVGPVIAGLEQRTGLVLERLVGPKD